MSEKTGSLIMDLQGSTLTAEEGELLNHPLIGGVILFARNHESGSQLQGLCQQIRSAAKQPLLVMVDQEGGRIQRFQQDFTRLPAMAIFGKRHDQNPATACAEARECGWLLARELLIHGIDLSLAPVLDLNKGLSTVIGERAFHGEPHRVVVLATALITGMREAGMAAVGKHFPGHGSVATDSHTAMAIDERSLQEISQNDLQVFAGMIKAMIPALMAAHIIFPEVDSLPVGFSARWLRDILRKDLGFDGVVFSDDLNMAGANIAERHADRVLAAREAGCDFVLLCNNRNGVIAALDVMPITKHRIEKSRWGVLQGQHQASSAARLQHARALLHTINGGI